MHFSQADIQQLQQVLREQIYSLTLDKGYYIATAKYFSELNNKVVSTEMYTYAENQQQKINKLAELQRKLKRTKYSLVQIDPWSEEDLVLDGGW